MAFGCSSLGDRPVAREPALSCTRDSGADPVVVIGAGPVGVRFAQELHRLAPALPLVIYGREPCEPYNRAQLSACLAGQADWSSLAYGLELPRAPQVQVRLGCEVLAIDRDAGQVLDAGGRWQPFSRLVLATGSRAHLPDIPGIGLDNVLVFRDAADMVRLHECKLRSRRTVVLGGGTLGLETALAMQRFGAEVWLIAQAERLMHHQLDPEGSALLRAHVERLGVRVLTSERVTSLHGLRGVEWISLFNGGHIACDTVVVAAGIRPNVQLALDCGLTVERGIRVDDAMRTADPGILAIGDCAEHRGAVYGLLAPGLEQAAVAVQSALGRPARYGGSVAVARLKISDLPVLVLGRVDASTPCSAGHDAPGVHRRVFVRDGRLAGALAIGECAEASRLHEAALARRRVWPWQLWRFRRTGRLWPSRERDTVADWPARAVVCNCNGVTRGALTAAIAAGCVSVAELSARTGASTACGSCRPLMSELVAHIGGAGAVAPARACRWLAAAAALAVALSFVLLFLPGMPYRQTAQPGFEWDRLWRDSFWKQASGYAVLALIAAGLAMSLRKRVAPLRRGDFSLWRLLHAALGVLALLGLLAHTGGRLGAQLDAVLMLSCAGLAALGGACAAVIAFEHRLSPALVRCWREHGLWLHILLCWPLPVLLAFHILKSYYF